MPPLPRGTASVTTLLLAGMLALTGPVTVQAQEDAAPEAAPAEPAAKPKPRPRKPAPKKEEPKEATSAAPSGTVLEPAAASGSAQWPAGASSVSESYGDWTMNCNRAEARTDCVIIQSQGDRRTGKRLFSFELRPPKDGKSEGLILMPFGLQIEPGVSFKLDDRQLGKGAPFSFCVSDGCLVPVSLPTLATDTMKTATNLTISATKPDAKEPTIITVPLSGFAAAFARASAFGS
ncbi:invasion associated locus B family protein [Methylorubrum rhodesianum]|jgi:invasion protein IalB|uniref:Invasion associated locus B family protein n=1 Tax=Methylorubrum rhodesianum TaxID=29427 RepID=A0ABU9ZEA0_9HYPH|nr:MULTISPECIES: invasion associated locus B family protein [Methylorubrum]MBY0142808.1 invasion associated locus B family protein [Methylorubrum populi]MRI52806.1 invasion associated locus B family protein [Methylobacterium sp. DB1607]MBB5762966.1 invasion protein IalB [Methylorubrum rhodesianum]MBI1688744.1 invasion associated locus B family protein [Methylorubrum sp. DB1722]MBK3404815.1 invasion associated locus B family protein [Methylorubrum rhodesianum]